MTIGQLFNECAVQITQGNGDKEVFITTDDEGNNVHKLFYAFTTGEEVKEFYGLNPDKQVLLG